MSNKQTLSKRIIIAFTLMTLVIGSLFSASIIVSVHFVEQYLISDELLTEITPIIYNYRAKQPIFLDYKKRFFVEKSAEFSPPKNYLNLHKGFNEVVNDKGNYYLYIVENNGQRYFLEQEQNNFEQREKILYYAVFTSLILSVLIAWYIGTHLARTVISPVTRLAQQVSNREQVDYLSPNLAPEYADDEVGHLAYSFDNTLQKLRNALMRESLYTSDVSHELRTPLMVVSSSTELLLADPKLNPKNRRLIERIDHANTEMRDLVRVFQMLARSEKNTTSDSGVVNIDDMLRTIKETWRERAQQKGLDFIIEHESINTHVVNATLLNAVLNNVLRNALHYTDHGYIKLSVNAQGFRVEDTGTGISDEQHQKIFLPYVRGSHARGEGMGVGLSLVKRICEYLSWDIEVHNRQGGGSCFSVIFDQALSAENKT